MEGAFKLTKILNGIMWYAEIRVAAEPAAVDSIVISPTAFAWRLEVYGPDAWGATGDAVWEPPVVEGVEYALRRRRSLRPAEAWSIAVTRIHGTDTDTTPAALKYAAAITVGQALGFDTGASWAPTGPVFAET